MKKTMLSMVAAVAATAAFAAANDILITFSTPGPDKYADGTTVMDGERYALCWSTDFDAFKVNPDGTAENGEIVLSAPVAKNGRCPTIMFEIDADYAVEKNFASGKWAVYMLDTRRFAKDGAVSSVGAAGKVNTFGLVGTSVSVGTCSVGSLAGATGETTSIAGTVAAPEITGIKVDGGKVFVTVKGAPYLGYGLVAGATPDAVTSNVEGATSTPTGDEEVTIVTEAKAGGEFFKANRK